MEVTQLTVMSFLILRFRSFKSVHPAGKVLAAQSCLSLCDPMDCSLPGSSVHGILQTRILQWVARSFSRGSFLTQALNPGLLHCKQILYHLSHQGCYIMLYNGTNGSPFITLQVARPLRKHQRCSRIQQSWFLQGSYLPSHSSS